MHGTKVFANCNIIDIVSKGESAVQALQYDHHSRRPPLYRSLRDFDHSLFQAHFGAKKMSLTFSLRLRNGDSHRQLFYRSIKDMVIAILFTSTRRISLSFIQRRPALYMSEGSRCIKGRVVRFDPADVIRYKTTRKRAEHDERDGASGVEHSTTPFYKVSKMEFADYQDQLISCISDLDGKPVNVSELFQTLQLRCHGAPCIRRLIRHAPK